MEQEQLETSGRSIENIIHDQRIRWSENSDEVAEEYVCKLRFYLPIDFGNFENNEYIDYLQHACCENYKNGKYQFSLIAYHMLFMSILYKEFWELKYFSNEVVNALCSNNNDFANIENVFDASVISEKDFINNFLGVFSWHKNKKSTYKEFVDKRDKCAHSSGFIQYDKDDVNNYFSSVLKNTEKISEAYKNYLVKIYKNALNGYLNSSSFENTTMVDYISHELADKKYSYRDVAELLNVKYPKNINQLKHILAINIANTFLSLTMEDAGYACDPNNSVYCIENLCSFWEGLLPEDRDNLQLQLEYEIEMLEEKGFSIPRLKELISDD